MRRIPASFRALRPDVSDLCIVAGVALLWTTYGPGLAGGLLLAIGLLPALSALIRR